MKTIVAADIHGITPELKVLFVPLGPDVLFASPWGDGMRPCSSEAEAVAHFLTQQGLQTYASRLAQMVGEEPTFFVGLSVGASSVWLHAATAACHAQSEAVLYYGSRIRDWAHLYLRCRTTLVFAEHEPSFDPQDLAVRLNKPGQQATVLVGTAHGFMNPLSEHYAPEAVQQQIAWLCARQRAWQARVGQLEN